MKPKITSVTKYLKGVCSASARGRVRRGLKTALIAAGDPTPELLSRLNDDKRRLLAEAIFAVEDELESRGDGRPHDPVIVQLRAARNRVYDDLRYNEYQNDPPPQVRV